MDNLILQQWIDNLRRLSFELKALNGSTEKDFIDIGSRLGELF